MNTIVRRIALICLLVGLSRAGQGNAQSSYPQEGYYDCNAYSFHVNRAGILSVKNAADTLAMPQDADVWINGRWIDLLLVRAQPPHRTSRPIAILPVQPGDRWLVQGVYGCKDSGVIPTRQPAKGAGS